MDKNINMILIKEINRNFQVNVRYEKFDKVLTMLGDLAESCVEVEAQQQVYETYQRLIKWAQHDNHHVIANLLLWHGSRLIVKYGSDADREMLDEVTLCYKALSPKDRLKYNFTEIVYDRLAAYELQLITDIKAFIADVKAGTVLPDEQKAKLGWFNTYLNFIKMIPIPNGYPLVKTEPLGAGYGKVGVRTEILKFAYLKIRLFEVAVGAFQLVDQERIGRIGWAQSTAVSTANKFRSIMSGLKEKLERYIRHAKEDKEELVILLNPGYLTTEEGINTDDMEFKFAVNCGYRETTFREFLAVHPKEIAATYVDLSYSATWSGTKNQGAIQVSA